jgi:hypothetical protein
MIGNLNVSMDTKNNAQDDVEVNGFNRRNLINNNFLGKLINLHKDFRITSRFALQEKSLT